MEKFSETLNGAPCVGYVLIFSVGQILRHYLRDCIRRSITFSALLLFFFFFLCVCVFCFNDLKFSVLVMNCYCTGFKAKEKVWNNRCEIISIYKSV